MAELHSSKKDIKSIIKEVSVFQVSGKLQICIQIVD